MNLVRFLLLWSFHFCQISSFAQEINKEISNIMQKYSAIGVSVVAVKNDSIVFSRSYGYNPDYNNANRRVPIHNDGIYVIQSISKTFISTAVMQLVEKGLIKLDDDVNQYLTFNVRNPKFIDVPITVRMLLSHRSTINDKHYGWNLNQINPEKGEKWRECYNDYKPGTKFSYCNLNYNLLGAIIENVTDERFFDFIDDNIVDPLGLNASYNLTKIDSTKLVRAYRYNKKSKRFKKDDSIYNYRYYKEKLKDYKLGYSTACFSPSGGMKISAVDLAKYMMMHMNYGEYNGKKIISKESEQEMTNPIAADTTYALGFFRNKDILMEDTIIGVRGSAHGIHSAMYFNPEKKYGFVVICNGCTNDRKMKDSIVRALYKHFIKTEFEN